MAFPVGAASVSILWTVLLLEDGQVLTKIGEKYLEETIYSTLLPVAAR